MSDREHPHQKIPQTLTLLWRMIAYNPRLYLFNLLAWIGVHNIGILAELIGREFFNKLDFQGSVLSMNSIIVLTVAAAVARISIFMIGSWIDAHHRAQTRGMPQRNFMFLVFRRPGADLLGGSSGEAVATIRDESETLCDGISWSIDMVGEVIALAVGLYILTSLDLTLTLTTYLPLVFVALISRKLEDGVQQAREKAQTASAAIGERIGDIFAAIQAVQVAGAEAPVLAHLKRLYAERRALVLRERLYSILFEATFYLNFSLVTAAILWLAADRLLLGTLSIGDLLLFINYVDVLTDNMLFFGMLIVNYIKCGVGFKRLAALLQSNDPSPLVEPTPDILPGDAYDIDAVANLLPISTISSSPSPSSATSLRQLSIKGLSFIYPQSQKGIRDIHLSLPQGSFTVITGKIGSGKTTFLRAILGLIGSVSGDIYWNDTRVETPADFFVPPHSAYTPQLPVLLSATLRENLALGSSFSEAELLEALEMVHFGPDLARLEHGLATEVGSRGVKLSGGQVQRVATARALIRRPELLVLDDLSSALDVHTEQALWQNLERTSATFLVVSHRNAAFRRADQIVVLDDGRISGIGTWQELLETNAIFSALWDQSPQAEAEVEQ